MLEHLSLRNFRGIETVDFNPLGQVNLIVGGNNTGKTSVLEAIVLLFGSNTQLCKLPNQFRQSANNNDDWSNFWPKLALNEEFVDLEIKSNLAKIGADHDRNGGMRLLRATASEEPAEIVRILDAMNGQVGGRQIKSPAKLSILSTTQPSPIETSRLFNEIAPLNPENEVKLETLLRESIDPRLRRLRYAKPKDTKEHLVYVDLGRGPMIPFTQMGQAFARALHIYCEIFSQNPDILLIDEIENGLYYMGLEDFWKGLFGVLVDQKVQLFATTHSRECMESALLADQKYVDSKLCFLRLDRNIDKPEEISGISFGRETMAEAIKFKQEMR